MKKRILAMLLTAMCMQAHALYITVNSPNGGESFARGEALTVNWVDNVSENVKIELLKNGTAVQTIANSTESDGSFLWQIPSTGIEAAGGYQVMISSTVTNLVTDQSGSFSITGGYIEGNVSGFWPKSGSPYIIGADVTVPANQTLTIEPGSEVLFNAPAQFTVQGRLLALGTKDEKIRFAPQDTSRYWYGLNFEKSNADTSKVEYSEITGVKADSWIKEYGDGQFNDLVATEDGGYIAVSSNANYNLKI